MTRPLIGVTANAHRVNDLYDAQVSGDRSIQAVLETTGAMAVILPGMPEAGSTAEWLDLLDGLVLTGGRPNVHPDWYGEKDDGRHGPFDRGRDSVMLPLTRAMVEAGKPVFGICRGIQEMNVAYGGSLHPEVRDEPGRMNHRMPPDETDSAVIFAKRHRVALTAGGVFERLLGTREIITNSLHGQACWRLGDGVAVEGIAEDGTIEAISIPAARRFALGVQWHAEYEALEDSMHRTLWEAFAADVDAAFTEHRGLARRSA
ncbi:MAG: gamma-glutamyl-gamma-aminobutyrate hydrolase family protein [Pseudomonadota bacterium]